MSGGLLDLGGLVGRVRLADRFGWSAVRSFLGDCAGCFVVVLRSAACRGCCFGGKIIDSFLLCVWFVLMKVLG